jgi:putative FmdB family regulatory protein
MPLYEYHCEHDDRIFEALGSIASSDRPARCPKCGRLSPRIMPTTVATMSRVKGLVERVPFHHHDVRTEKKNRTIAPVKPKGRKGTKPAASARRTSTAQKKKKG